MRKVTVSEADGLTLELEYINIYGGGLVRYKLRATKETFFRLPSTDSMRASARKAHLNRFTEEKRTEIHSNQTAFYREIIFLMEAQSTVEDRNNFLALVRQKIR